MADFNHRIYRDNVIILKLESLGCRHCVSKSVLINQKALLLYVNNRKDSANFAAAHSVFTANK